MNHLGAIFDLPNYIFFEIFLWKVIRIFHVFWAEWAVLNRSSIPAPPGVSLFQGTQPNAATNSSIWI